MKRKNIVTLVASILICELAGVIGSVFTTSSVTTWYTTLVKPPLNPPSWIFGPIWTTLYLLMGISAYLVWQKGLKQDAVKNALSIFAVQLVLNASWSIVFFGFHDPGAAFIVIILLWLSIVCAIIKFFSISRPAAYLLLPYLAWVSFASYLNFMLWTLNA